MYSVFLDDSEKNNVALIGGILCLDENIALITGKINEIKNNYNLPENIKLHCRQLFYQDQRNKLNIKISLEEIFKLYEDLFKYIITSNMIPIICWVDKRILPSKIPPIPEQSAYIWPEMCFGGKNWSVYCAHGIVQHLEKSILNAYVEYYISKDCTRISWFGKKRQVSKARMFIEKNDSAEYADIKELDSHILFEVADAIAYFSSNSLNTQHFSNGTEGNDIKQFCKSQHSSLALIEMQFILHKGGLSLKVIKDSALYKILA